MSYITYKGWKQWEFEVLEFIHSRKNNKNVYCRVYTKGLLGFTLFIVVCTKMPTSFLKIWTYNLFLNQNNVYVHV